MRDATWAALADAGITRSDPSRWTRERPAHLQQLKANPAFRAIGGSRWLEAIETALDIHGRTLARDAGVVLRGLWAESQVGRAPNEGWREPAVFALRGRVQPRHRCHPLARALWRRHRGAVGLGETPFLGAIGWSHFEAAAAMLTCGANVNAQNDRGMTAAHMMVKKGSDCKHFELFVRYGARFDLPNNDGVTAAEIMLRKRDPRFRAQASYQWKAPPRYEVSAEIRGIEHSATGPAEATHELRRVRCMATRVGTIRGSRSLILWLRLRTGLNLPRTTVAVCAWALLLTPICAGQTPSGPAPVRVGSSFMTPQKVKDVPPVYPNAATAAGVEGLIILELTITRDGMVQDVRVLRSIPLRDQAAIDAVKQWVYAPTLLNGDRVPVIVTVTVNFALPHYLVTSTPISSVGLSQPLCIAVNPKDPEGVWW